MADPLGQMVSDYLMRSRARKLQQTMQHMDSPCVSCRRRSLFSYLHQRQDIRHIRNMVKLRSKSNATPHSVLETVQKARISKTPSKSVKPGVPNAHVGKDKVDLTNGHKSSDVDAASIAEARPSPAVKVVTPAFTPTRSPAIKKLVNGTTKSPAKVVTSPVVAKLANSKMKPPVAAAASPVVEKLVNGKTKASATAASSPGAGSRVSKSWPSQIGKAKVRGLDNPSQWCYRRSLQQALFCVPQFFNILEKHTKHQNGANCVACALAQSVQSYHSGSGDLRRSVSGLDRIIASTGKRSDPSWKNGGHSQDDSHDFLQYLLGTVEKASGIPKQQFKDSFHIGHESIWTCQRCHKKHTHIDPPSYSLPLSIYPAKGQPTLASCMDHFHKEENLTIRCDGCQKNIPRTRIKRIQHPPEALYIQLKRFDFVARARKNSKHVDYPDQLDLSKWCVDSKEPAKYKLQAVVAHSGSLKFGHYKAYVRDGDQIKQANDESISKSSQNEWRKPGGFDPYILLYLKQ